MNVLILCKDCSAQLSDNQSNKKMDSILDLSNSSKKTIIHFSECMGVCPTGKISTIKLTEKKINSMEKCALSLDQIYSLIN